LTEVRTHAFADPGLAVSDAVIEALSLDTADARGLPNEAFTSPAFLELEHRYLFPRTWVFAGMRSDVPDAGDVKPVTVAGRPLFLATGADGTTRVFHNVCPHRGARLVEEDSHGKKLLVCPYHAWSFTLEGSLKGRPHFHGPGAHEHSTGSGAGSDACLYEVRTGVWNDLIFVNLDGRAQDFDDYVAPLAAHFRDWDLTSFHYGNYRAYEFNSNWKLALENFCDNYHVFKVHPALDEMQTDQDRYPMTPAGSHLLSTFGLSDEGGRGLSVDPDGELLPEVEGVTEQMRRNLPFGNLFPNATIILFPSNLEFVVFEPRGVDRTVAHVHFFFHTEEAAKSGDFARAREQLADDWALVLAEDAAVCKGLQESRACDAYDGGRFSPYWDGGTLHFHKQIAQAVRGIGNHKR
jgi:choline monooxygenase